jgi:ABC-type multidrug transport system ATPase subunit
MLFSGEDVNKPISALSGGEAARLVFCRIMVSQPNVLVLDEPTNHLDLEAIGALVDALRAYEGTVLFVSHDRAFVSALATRILEVTEQGFRDFPGTYDEYLSRCGDDHLDAEQVVLRAKRDKAEQAQPAVGALSWEEQKRRNNRKKQLPAQRDDVMAAIERAEQRKAAIQADWAKPEFYATTDKARVSELEREEQALGAEITALMAKWEALEAEIASLTAE